MAGQAMYVPPTYAQLVEFWNAGHQPPPPPAQAIAGELLWATPEEAANYEAPRGKAVVLFIKGSTEAHIKSHNERTGEPTTIIIDYTERPQVDNSPYATKEQLLALDGKMNVVVAAGLHFRKAQFLALDEKMNKILTFLSGQPQQEGNDDGKQP